jgi:hypothetical protein
MADNAVGNGEAWLAVVGASFTVLAAGLYGHFYGPHPTDTVEFPMPDITVPSLPDFTGTSISNFSTEILQKLSKFQAQTANLNTQILQNLDHFQAQIKAISRATQAWRLIDTAFVIAFVLFFLFLVALFSRDAEI